MSSLSSVVQICNMALGWIGAERITSLDDASTEAILCKANYDTARDTVLESREWTFAVKRFALVPTGVTPEFTWGQQFDLPTEILRVLSVERGSVVGSNELSANVIEHEQMDWVREGNQILTNFDAVYVRAIIRIENTTFFSASFVHALAARIAADLAIPITRSKVLQQQMFALYQAKLADAAALDGMQGRSKRIRSRYLAARR
jgi:hypothetical protein